MRGIPPRTMGDIWSKPGKKEKAKVIVRYIPQKEKISKVDEEMVRQIARGVTEGLMTTLGEEIAKKILPSLPQTSTIKKDDRVQIKETFIDPTEKTKLEYNFRDWVRSRNQMPMFIKQFKLSKIFVLEKTPKRLNNARKTKTYSWW